MDHTLLDGRTPPEKGDRVRVRVLRSSNGDLAVDRPFKDRPLRLTGVDDALSIPDAPGTYEVRGTVTTAAFADSNGPDYFIFEEYAVDRVSEDLLQLPSEHSDTTPDSGDVSGVDIDVEDVLPGELTEEQDTSDGLSSGAKRLGESLNDLLIGSR